MKNSVRKALIVMGAFLGFFTLIVAGIWLSMWSAPAQRLIQSKINKKIPGTITWENSRSSLLGGTVELTNILLKGPKDNRLISADRLYLDISWIGLLHGALTAETVILEKPRVWLCKDRRGKLTLLQAFADSGDEGRESSNANVPFNIQVKELSLVDGFFQYQDEGDALKGKNNRVELFNIDMIAQEGSLLEQTVTLALQIGKGHINISDIETPLDQFRLKTRLCRDRLDPLNLKLSAGGSVIDVNGTISKLFSDLLLDLDISILTSFSETRKIFQIKPEMSGSADTRVTVKGPLNNPDVALKMEYGDGNFAGNRIDGITLDLLLKDRRLSINHTDLASPFGKFNIVGSVDFQKAFPEGLFSSRWNPNAVSFELRLGQKETPLEKLLGGNLHMQGSLNTNLTLEGSGISLETLSAFATTESTAVGIIFNKTHAPVDLHVTSQAHIEQGRIRIKQIEARVGKARLSAGGYYDVVSRELTALLNLEAPDLTETLGKDFQGELGLNARVDGQFSHPVADARLKGKNLKFQNIRVDELLAGLRIAKGRIFLDHASLRSSKSKLDISGSAQMLDTRARHLAKNPAFDFNLAGANLFMEDFVEELKGKLTISGHLKGKVLDPEGSVIIEGKNIELGGQKFTGVYLNSRLEKGKVFIDPFIVALAPGEEIRTEGWLSLEKHYDLRAISKGISIKNITVLKTQGFEEGKLSFNISGNGSFEDPALTGDAVISGILLNNKRLDELRFRADLRDQMIQIQGDLDFDINATLNLKTKAFSAIAGFDRTDPAPFLQLAGMNEINGVVTGKIEANGNINAPDRIIVRADMERLDLFHRNKEVVRAGKFNVSFQNGLVSVPGIHLTLLTQGYVDIKGKGSLDSQLDFEAEGDIPSGVVMLFTDRISEISGTVHFSTTMKGSLTHPDLRADIHLRQLGFVIPESLQRVRDVEGSILVTSQDVTVKNIQGKLDSGRFDLNGRIDLEQFRPSLIKARLNAHELPLTFPDTMEISVDTHLEIQGSPEKSVIKGKAVLLEGKYFKDIELNLIEVMGTKKREAPLPRSEELPSILNNTELDIRITHKAPFVVENNLASLEVAPDLRLYGKVNQPRLSGRAEVTSGIIMFQEKNFEIKRGIFDFVNPYKIEPEIDVRSQTVVRDWTIYLDVSGIPENLEFKMSSDPPEDNSDILSLLAFGKTRREMDAADGGISASPTQMIADLTARTLQEKLKDATGLDMVELEYQEAEDKDDSSDIKITVGKRLSRRMAVTYGMETKNGVMVHRFTTEQKILEQLILNAFNDNEGVFGGEMLFRLEFR